MTLWIQGNEKFILVLSLNQQSVDAYITKRLVDIIMKYNSVC